MVYNFTFKEGWGALKGIYRVDAIYSYSEYLKEEGDILKDFYEPNGKTISEVNADLPKLRESKIYRLATVDESVETTIHHAPELYVESSPDYLVDQYVKFGIVCTVGITKRPEDLNYIKDNIVQNVEASLGITPNINFVNLGKVWMTETQYQEELKKRDESKKKALNYFSEMRRLTLELKSSQQKVREYEKLIIQLSKSNQTKEGK